MPKVAHLVLGNQLFDPSKHENFKGRHVFMREDVELCTHFKYHKLKISFFLQAMRSYADELKALSIEVTYQPLADAAQPYEFHFKKWLIDNEISDVSVFEIEDKFFEKRIFTVLTDLGLSYRVVRSPMFITTRDQFKKYLGNHRRPFMKTFYEQQRRQFKILIEPNGEPVGGRWSFDELNRKPLPKTIEPPRPYSHQKTQHEEAVHEICETRFGDHPGRLSTLWAATTREGAFNHLELFLNERFANFGPYEDALAPHSDFVFHSALTPYLNTGLLTPRDVVTQALEFAKINKINISSVEGFIRQVIGWREFIRGIYQNFSDKQDSLNFFQHKNKLSLHWYEASTGILPLDNVIEKTLNYGYAHHIERLMVAGSLMVLLEIDPHEAHRWFMEMFIDSSDWVMGPNVYGMALFSDGGIFATKPYICGSNYYRKMGHYKQELWCDGIDGLYWRFIEKHAGFFQKNARMAMVVQTAQAMPLEKRQRLHAAADELKLRLTTPPTF